jgi:hypothetical protein
VDNPRLETAGRDMAREEDDSMKVSLTLRSEPGNWQSPPVKRLAILLKAMLRGYGWRCESAVELPEEGNGDANMLATEREALERISR